MNKKHIVTTNKEERIAIVNALIANGYKWHGSEVYSGEKVEENYPFDNWPCINIGNNGELSGSGKKSGLGSETTIAEVLRSGPHKPSVKLKLNDNYTAEVHPDGSVEVGCQTFTADKVEELYNLVKKMRSK